MDSARISFFKLKRIHETTCLYWQKRGSKCESIPLWMANVALRAASEVIAGNDATWRDRDLESIRQIVRQSISPSNHETPHWFPPTEAALHITERMLGAAIDPRARLHFHTSRTRGQECGAYSTPNAIAQQLISDILAARRRNGPMTILDLSVEAGQFPITALARMRRYDRVAFYGVDRDPAALRLTRRLYNFSQKYACNDRFDLSLTRADSVLETLPPRFPGKFDVVIGNPPWATLRGDYTNLVRDAFQPLLSNNFDLYLAFILRADSLLCGDGLLGFVVPNSLLFNDSAQRVRKHLLQRYNVVSLRVYPRASFAEIQCIAPVSIVLSRKTGSTSITSRIAYHAKNSPVPRAERFCDANRLWSALPGQVFHPLVRPSFPAFARRISRLPRLCDFGAVLPGARFQDKEGVVPAVPFEGFKARDLRPFHACDAGSWKYTPRNIRFRTAPRPADVASSKVFFQTIRFITDARRLVAAAGGPGTYAVSTASMFIARDLHQTGFFEAVLNCSVANAWFKSRDVSRAIKLEIVRDIPIPIDFSCEELVSSLGRRCANLRLQIHQWLVHCTRAGRERLITQGVRGLFEELQKSQAELENLLFELYGLPPRERQYIRELSSARVF